MRVMVYSNNLATCLLAASMLLLNMDCGKGDSIPVLITRGNHYQVGHDMGSTFQSRIQSYFAKDSLMINTLLPFINTQEGNQIYKEYFQVVNNSYPQYLEEMHGIADGSGVSFDQIFLNVLRREITGLLGLENMVPDACSDVHISDSYNDVHGFGHNEDGDSDVDGHAYIVVAEISNDKPRGKLTVPKEVFTAYVYPGALGGFAFGFNNFGLAFSMNALYPQKVLRAKTGHYILNRAMMSARSPQEVVSILTDEGVGTAYGTSVNLGDLNSKLTYNIEVAPNSGQNMSLTNVLNINASTAGTYYHVNMYRRISIAEDQSHILSSLHRAARIEALPFPESKADILNVLGDRFDATWPIFRDHEKDNSSTLCTAFFDLDNWTMELYKGNPSHDAVPLHIFKIPKTE